MEVDRSCIVNRAVEDALRDAAESFDARGVLVATRLEARGPVSVDEPVVYQAVYTLMRGIPMRLTPGATVFVGTSDRAGGDVELVWEAREESGGVAETPLEALERGPHGDLFKLALLGLEAIARARGALRETTEPPPPRSSSATAHALDGKVRRRFMFLIPGKVRDAHGAYARFEE